MKNIYIFLIILLFIVIFTFNYTYDLFDNTNNQILFSKLDNTIIASINYYTHNILHEQEILNIFNNFNIIKVTIPDNYKIKIIYKNINELKEFSNTLILQTGIHFLNKQNDNKNIYQIEIYKTQTDIQDDLIIKDIYQNTLFMGSQDVPVDWDLIYRKYGYDDYYIYYPTKKVTKTYFYNNHPRYELYQPSKRIKKELYNPYYEKKRHNFFRANH